MSTEVVVIGAGVVGLAVARALANEGRDVLVLESAGQFGTGTSSRNSEVIHSGIYYDRMPLKARLCVAGRDLLYRYCRERGIAHRQLGKLIIATRVSEVDVLRAYCESAEANGAGALVWKSVEEVSALEPAISCVAAVHAPLTGIVDSHALMLSFLGDLESAGGQVIYRARVLGARAAVGGGFDVRVGGDEEVILRCRALVNCSGLTAPAVARTIDGLPPESLPAQRYAKGHYFILAGRSPFTHLVYPIAEPGGLGVHVTLDLGGSAKFGPDVQWVDEIDYTFDETRRERFCESIRRYYPGLDASRLQAGYTGIRPKIRGPGEPAADFRIDGSQVHGVNGLVNLMGIESPGLTASLAIGEHVRALLGGTAPACKSARPLDSGRETRQG